MLLTHESKVELDYLSLFNMGIHVPGCWKVGSHLQRDSCLDQVPAQEVVQSGDGAL